MSSSLIRGKYVICKTINRFEVEVIEAGAVFQQDGKIIEIGSYEDLATKYQPDQIIGSPEHVVLPGFVNCHHHIGLTPFQLGSPDYPLELWFASRLAARSVDLYLDTLYSAFEMVESGITTVQHIHGWQPGPATNWVSVANEVIQAYQDLGMRSSYCFAVRDQNHFVYEQNEAFIKKLPSHIALEMAEILKTQEVPLQDHLDFFEALWQKWDCNQSSRIRIQLAPANLHWCSDQALEALQTYAMKYEVGLHMHLLETHYQKEYAYRRTGKTAVQHLQAMGMLGPHVTLGHGVWLTEDDIDLVSETNTMICHNASSNLRLQSGIAPLNHYAKKGVVVGIGLDEAGINDDRNMLQEMRLVLNLHRVPGMDAIVPTSPQVFQMATEHGAKTTGFAKQIGTLEVGKAADIVLMDWNHIAYPYLDEEISVIDAVIYRSRTAGVKAVMVEGEVIYQDGQFTRVDKSSALDELANLLKAPRTQAEKRRQILAREVFPYVKQFYEGWLDHRHCDPFYCQNCRH
jgi:cytosine/adenosine deaminase-related metal-dependent hydrolase